MNSCWLSIITISKDDPAGLARAVTSANALRDCGAEHLVIDGSVHASISADGAAHEKEGVTYLVRPPRGVADAFNAGLARARGEWVWFLNGGDAVHELLDPRWLKTLLGSTQAQVVTGALHFDGEAAARPQPHLSYQWPLIACWLAHPATLVRRDVLERGGGFDPELRIAMDYDLWLRLLQSDLAVDVLSVPFARFDVTGMSERADMRDVARREERRVIRKHGFKLVAAGSWLWLRTVRRVMKAVAGTLRR